MRTYRRCRRSLSIQLFACVPMVLVPPAARADGLDIIFDPIINSIDHSLAGVDALSGVDPGASLATLPTPTTRV